MELYTGALRTNSGLWPWDCNLSFSEPLDLFLDQLCLVSYSTQPVSFGSLTVAAEATAGFTTTLL